MLHSFGVALIRVAGLWSDDHSSSPAGFGYWKSGHPTKLGKAGLCQKRPNSFFAGSLAFIQFERRSGKSQAGLSTDGSRKRLLLG